MFKNKKGFSLIILIVAIVVIVIITSTAIITIKSISDDRAISEFMNDLSDVKQFVIEYYGRDGTLPIKESESNASEELLSLMSGDSALYQISDEDGGNYYYVDLERLGKIHLTDSTRGYILNENSLNIYVTKPIFYEGTNYYTLTKNLTGRELVVNSDKSFEISITGNPIKWATKADILVSITDKRFNSGDEVNWNFKWLKGSKTADDFKTSNEAHYFTYGDLITFTENGIYTIYIEGPDAKPIIRKVVVSKIDNIKPKVKIEGGKLIIDDSETGVKSIRCKIKETDRANINTATRERYPDVYMMNREQITDTEESLLESYLWGSRNLKGDTINDYLKDFDDYYRQFVVFNNVIASIDSTSGEIENAQSGLRALNSNYPQFAYDNKMFGNSEKNIVLYVEDMCGNATVYSAISRNELKALQYVSSDVGTLSDIKLVINNNAQYTNDRNLQLFIQAMYAESYFITEEKVDTPVWKNFDTSRDNFMASEGNGEKIIYAFFKDANGKIKSTYDKIYLDEDEPTNTAPTVSRTASNLSIRSNQTDADSGIASVRYGVKENNGLSYTWYQRVSDIPDLDASKTYKIVTEAMDKAGNKQLSIEVELKGTSSMIAGDYVDYSATSNTYSTNTRDDGNTGTESVSLSTETDIKWLVLYVDETEKKVYITPDKAVNSGVTLNGTKGYYNGAKELNNICEELYSKGSYKARSISIEDLNNVCNHNPIYSTRYAYYPSGTTFGAGNTTVEYNGILYTKVAHEANNYRFYKGNSARINCANSFETDGDGFEYIEPTASNPVYVIKTYDGYSITNSAIQTILTSTDTFVASPCVNADTDKAEFSIYSVDSSSCECVALADSEGEVASVSRALRPVVVINVSAFTGVGNGSEDNPWKIRN